MKGQAMIDAFIHEKVVLNMREQATTKVQPSARAETVGIISEQEYRIEALEKAAQMALNALESVSSGDERDATTKAIFALKEVLK